MRSETTADISDSIAPSMATVIAGEISDPCDFFGHLKPRGTLPALEKLHQLGLGTSRRGDSDEEAVAIVPPHPSRSRDPSLHTSALPKAWGRATCPSFPSKRRLLRRGVSRVRWNRRLPEQRT